jgi:hypothetical protein
MSKKDEAWGKRKDKVWGIGSLFIKYIHYYPGMGSISTWGFQTSNFKGFSVDFFFGRHVIVFYFDWMD